MALITTIILVIVCALAFFDRKWHRERLEDVRASAWAKWAAFDEARLRAGRTEMIDLRHLMNAGPNP